MSDELQIYKKQVENLENYLMKCVRLFDGYNASLMQKKGKAPIDLLECIQNVLHAPSVSKEGTYLEGIEYAYRDCINLLGLIADDTEVHLPKNKKGMQLAAAYRTLGDGMIERMNIMLERYKNE